MAGSPRPPPIGQRLVARQQRLDQARHAADLQEHDRRQQQVEHAERAGALLGGRDQDLGDVGAAQRVAQAAGDLGGAKRRRRDQARQRPITISRASSSVKCRTDSSASAPAPAAADQRGRRDQRQQQREADAHGAPAAAGRRAAPPSRSPAATRAAPSAVATTMPSRPGGGMRGQRQRRDREQHRLREAHQRRPEHRPHRHQHDHARRPAWGRTPASGPGSAWRPGTARPGSRSPCWRSAAAPTAAAPARSPSRIAFSTRVVAEVVMRSSAAGRGSPASSRRRATNSSSLNGSDTVVGDSMCMPSASSRFAITMSTTRNGMNSRKPIWNARRSSDVTNAGTMTPKSRSLTPARSAGVRIFERHARGTTRGRAGRCA